MHTQATQNDCEEFTRAKELYLSFKEALMLGFPGYYLLIHTATLKSAVGKDDEGGYKQAMERFRNRHGDLTGQFFGMRIPNRIV